MNNKSQKKMLTFCSAILVLIFLSPITLGQSKKELNKKLDKIKGKVEKISIQTDKGTVNFTGEEAEEILKKLKKKEHKYVFATIDDDSFRDDGYNILFFSDDDDVLKVESGKDGIKETIEVKEVDGKKEVTIKTTKDGKTTLKTLRGKEAEEYLDKKDKHSKHLSWVEKDGKKVKIKMGKFKVDINDKEWMDKNGKDIIDIIISKNKMKKHFIHKDDLNIEKTIDVKVKDGNKEVTVTTTKNGKKSIKVYKGKEADKFLEDINDDDDMTIDIDVKDNVSKTIIIKKEKKIKKDK